MFLIFIKLILRNNTNLQRRFNEILTNLKYGECANKIHKIQL